MTTWSSHFFTITSCDSDNLIITFLHNYVVWQWQLDHHVSSQLRRVTVTTWLSSFFTITWCDSDNLIITFLQNYVVWQWQLDHHVFSQVRRVTVTTWLSRFFTITWCDRQIDHRLSSDVCCSDCTYTIINIFSHVCCDESDNLITTVSLHICGSDRKSDNLIATFFHKSVVMKVTSW